jgi:hypothetical protein
MGYDHPLFLGTKLPSQVHCLLGWIWLSNFLFGMIDVAVQFFVWLDDRFG